MPGSWFYTRKPSAITTIEFWAWRRYWYDEEGNITMVEWQD